MDLAFNHVSVDCVVFGFDGEQLKVLLIRRSGFQDGEIFHDMKLPGSIIYLDEDLDEAAVRVLYELTGLRDVHMRQFRAFGSSHRTDNPRDLVWLRHTTRQEILRIVTVAYIAAIPIDARIYLQSEGTDAVWVGLDDMPPLAFDHNQIISAALKRLAELVATDDSVVFNILPGKFTINQYRLILEAITGRKLDYANLYKKLPKMPYVVPLDEKQTGGQHRSARYYKYVPENKKQSE